MADKCIFCNFNTKKTKTSYSDRRVLSGEAYVWHRSYLASVCKKANVSEMSVLCGKCRRKLSNIKQQGTSARAEADESMVLEENDEKDDIDTTFKDECVSLKAIQAGKTHAKCIICLTEVKTGLCRVIPTKARFDLLIKFNVYADSASRICTSHLAGNRLSGTVEWSTNKEEVEMALTADQASTIIEGFLAVMREREQAFTLDFNDPMFTDQDCLV